jgi:hypothetical protein
VNGLKSRTFYSSERLPDRGKHLQLMLNAQLVMHFVISPFHYFFQLTNKGDGHCKHQRPHDPYQQPVTLMSPWSFTIFCGPPPCPWVYHKTFDLRLHFQLKILHHLQSPITVTYFWSQAGDYILGSVRCQCIITQRSLAT